MIKLGERLKEDICIECIELTITYSIYNQLIELNTNTYEDHSPSLFILDQEFDNRNNGVKIELSNLNEITLLIKDFENKFKQLTKNNGRNNK